MGTSSSGAYNATNCLLWEERRPLLVDEEDVTTVDGDSNDGSEFRLCSCYELTEKNNCLTWGCSQVMVDPNTVCVDDTNFHNQRLGEVCYTVVATSSTRCRCDDENELRFCTTWSCEEYLGGEVIHEKTNCVEISASQQYCSAWTGSLESPKMALTRACGCAAQEFGDEVCSVWECKEKGVDSCERCNDLTMSIACFGVLGLLGVIQLIRYFQEEEYFSCCVVFCILWIVAAAGAAIFYGGQTGGMYVGITWVGIGGLYAFCCRPTKE